MGYDKNGKNAYHYWQTLIGGVQKFRQSLASWEDYLSKKNYRVWNGKSSKTTVRARLHQFTPPKVILIKPNGNRIVTYLQRLSQKDQDWLKQKREFEIQQKLDKKSRH